MSYSEILDVEFRNLGLNLPANQHAQLTTYCNELERWNKKINLTSLAGRQLVQRLIAAPAWIGEHLGISGVLADIGSGNGSPAIPLAITRSLTAVHLIESRLKRAVFLRHIGASLRLREVSVHHARFEEAASNLESVTWVTLQAVALSAELREQIRKSCVATTKVVWISNNEIVARTASSLQIRVPGSNTTASVFHLDQF